ncbi:MAG: HPr family phosphocarrier protein [Deltaproteobacteria bacterium]|nr:HPr family phosphocarrier protein [Deltaproteobacteria bacterium]
MNIKENSYIKKTFTIGNKLGLHARAAAQFVQAANKFGADIFVEKNDHEVNGKSIMGIMMLAAGYGSKITIKANGPDADEAMQALQILIEKKFGEEE